jgi:hypothetical protein
MVMSFLLIDIKYVQKVRVRFWLCIPMVEPLLHHTTPLPYTGNVRGLYSPPDLPVTPRFSSFLYYCDNLGFLFGKKCRFFAPVTGTKCTLETCCLRGLFRDSEPVFTQKNWRYWQIQVF